MIQKKPLRAWLFERYRGAQAGLAAAVLAAVFLRVLPVEMQKRIVNEAIGQGKVDVLLVYSGLYLAAVVSASSLKYLTSVLQGYIGQRILLDIRSALYSHAIQLPLSFFRNTPAGTVINSLASELATVGEFLGSALSVPLTSILTLVAFAGYMAWLDPLLAALSFIVYPLEMAFIPFLQRRYNRLNRKRIDATRRLSDAIGEAVAGIHEVHGYASYPRESAKFDEVAHRIFRLRHRMNLWSYGVKFANNFLQKIGPFLLFLVGGYLAISGRFSLGALVAFLSAYDNLYDPWKELMEFYQLYQDSAVRYKRVMESFDAEPDFVLGDENRPPIVLSGAVEARNLGYTVEGGITLLDDINLNLAPGEQLALVGYSGSGKSSLALVLGQLVRYDRGHVLVDGLELKSLTKRDASANIGYVSQAPFIFGSTLRKNILYGVEVDSSRTVPEERILDIVDRVGLIDDILNFGLNARLDRALHSHLAYRFVEVRNQLIAGLPVRPGLLEGGEGTKGAEGASELDELVEHFDPERFLRYSDIYRNIVFGEPLDASLSSLLDNRLFVDFLRRQGLYRPLIDLGRILTTQTVRLLVDLGDDAQFSKDSPIPVEEFEEYREAAEALRERRGGSRESGEGRTEDTGQRSLTPEFEALFLKLALRFIPARHRMTTLSPDLEARILRARRAFMEESGQAGIARPCTPPAPAAPGKEHSFVFYCPNEYIFSQTLVENLLFGQIIDDRSGGLERAQAMAVEGLERAGLLREVLSIGLDFEVGSMGDRLSGGQRQKTALARALLKEPRILILDEATASLDNASQARIQRYLETELKGKCTVIAVIHRLDIVRAYDRIAVFRSGRIIEYGSYDELMASGGVFRELSQGLGGSGMPSGQPGDI